MGLKPAEHAASLDAEWCAPTIHQFWVGPSMPDRYREFATGWRRLHPDWAYYFWHEGNLPPLINRDLYDRADKLFGDLANQFRSDVLRYELLWQFGGVWADVDFECLRPLDSLLAGEACFVAWVTPEYVNNALMGAVRHHPFVARLIAGLSRSVATHPREAPRVVSGPQYLTRMFRKYGDTDGVRAFDSALFYPYLWRELHKGDDAFPEAYAVHHWGNRRRERGRPL